MNACIYSTTPGEKNNLQMIAVKAAKDIILANTDTLKPQFLPLADAAGLTLAEDIYANNDFPPFEQASMDGYAFKFSEWQGNELQLAGEVQAGSAEEGSFDKKNAVRIFTGAPVPSNLDTVVMQEKVVVKDGVLHIQDSNLVKGSNVRAKGSEMKKGALAVEKGTELNAGALGFIAGLGIERVNVIKAPVIAIIVTGKELQQVGKPLQYGQVYDSNSFALTAALQKAGARQITKHWCDDEPQLLLEHITSLLPVVDLLLLTGGVSVGDYDLVADALQKAGIEKIFHKVKQRPGKPLLFGKKDKTIVFGLPGNPGSVLSCFYEYVLVSISKMMDKRKSPLMVTFLPVAASYSVKAQLTHFLKGKINGAEVVILDAQESYRMRSFAVADCLVVLEEGKLTVEKGELVEVHLLP